MTSQCELCDDSMAYAGDYCPLCSLPIGPHDPHAPTGWAVAWLALAAAIAVVLVAL